MTEGHDDDAPRGRRPGDWGELVYRVGEASFVKVFNPSNPLVKIGDFDAMAVIGQGGFGIVFKGRDPELDRLVALKLCRTCSKSASDALLREAKVLAQLHHPNIITIFELGHHEGAVFFVMPYIEGQSVAKFADRDPAPSVQEILRVYRHVARGLAAAHREKIVHGDIKPSNFLLDRDDFARIADFGLARRVIQDADESEQEGLRRRAGTLYYMAPEALCGEPCTARSDQFSFFVALCQTLAGGELPFYGKTSGEVLDAMERTDISQFLGPWVPAELKAVIRIGLSLEPNERFPDMETVEAEIDRVLQTPPSSLPPRDEPERESDEPESDESDGPERMHGPAELSDEPAVMVGEPEVMVSEPPPLEPVGDSPLIEPELLEPELLEPEGPELTPLGGGLAPSKVTRGVLSASLLLVAGLTLGWVGRARVGDPRPSDDPVPLPSLACALGDSAEGSSVDIDPSVIAACTYIRQGQFVDADTYWTTMYDSRRKAIKNPGPNLEDSADKLAADTMIVVQTFRDQAERLARQSGKQAEKAAKLARGYAKGWTPRVAEAQALGDANGLTGESTDSSVETTN